MMKTLKKLFRRTTKPEKEKFIGHPHYRIVKDKS